MSVTTTPSLVQYTIASLGQAFTPGFAIQNTSDIVVTYTNATTYADTVLTLNTDFFVTGTFSSGVCTNPTVTLEGSGLHYAVGGKLTVQRAEGFTQPTTLVDAQQFPAATFNTAWDWIVYHVQALKDRLDRVSFQQAPTTAVNSTIPFANRLGRLAGWDDNGLPTTYFLPQTGIQPFPATLQGTFPFFFPTITASTLHTVPTADAPVPCMAILVQGTDPAFSSSLWYLVGSSATVGTGVVQPDDDASLRWIQVG